MSRSSRLQTLGLKFTATDAQVAASIAEKEFRSVALVGLSEIYGAITESNAAVITAIEGIEGGGGGGGGGLTDAELRATPVPVSIPGSVAVTGAFFQATQPISAVTLPLPTDASTSALQTDANALLTTIAGIDFATDAGLAVVNGNIVSCDDKLGDILASSTAIQADTGSIITSLSNIQTKLDDQYALTGDVLAAVADVETAVATSDRTTAAAPSSVRLSDGAAFYNAPTSAQLPSALVGGRLDVNNGSWLGSTTPTVGQKVMAESIPVTIASNQGAVLFRGRASTFRTAGNGLATGQSLLSLFNAGGSSVKVRLTAATLDSYQSVIKAVNVPAPYARLWKIAAAPTDGTVLSKIKIGGTTTSNASVVARGTASADGVASAPVLATTRPAGQFLESIATSRVITGAAYENADKMEFKIGEPIELLAGEGVVIFLDCFAITQNVTTDMWFSTVEWTET